MVGKKGGRWQGRLCNEHTHYPGKVVERKQVLSELLYAADKYQLTGLVSGNLTFKTNLSRFDPPKLVGPFYLANFSPLTISPS